MIIGLGFKARAGKDTVATHLVNNHNFIQESFAYPLKEYIGRHICGFNDKQLYGAWKETIDPEWGRTPRQMLQLIGTDALRKIVHDDFWIIPMKRKLKEHIRNGRNVVISDVRFLNEINLIRSLMGYVVRIDRNNPDQITGFEKHTSEVELEQYNEWNGYLDNNNILDSLYNRVDLMLTNSGLDKLALGTFGKMKQYQELLKYILNTGAVKEDRTGTGTLSVFGHQMRFNLQEGFPLITTKKVYWHGVVEELLWFLRGETNIRSLVEKNVHIWDAWADNDGNLGPVYGKQWRNWWVYDKGDICIDQIADVIKQIKTNPDSRRLIVNAWNVGEIDQMALPPCHMFFQFYVNKGKLSCQWYQRSCDAFLGLPFNIASYALLTHMIAQVCDLEVAELITSIGDLHIYNNHLEQVMLQLSREPKELPKLELDHSIKNIDDFDGTHIKIIGYDPYPTIKAEVAV